MKYRFSDQPLFDRFARLLTADGDPAPGGGSAPAAADAPPAAGGAAPAAGAGAPAAAPNAEPAKTDPAPASEPTSLLSDAKPAEPEKPPAETEAQKAERLKNETPEEKTAREAKEAEARTEALKVYDTLKLPEGMLADQPAFVDFKNAALDLGIEPAKAQTLIDTVAPKMKEAAEAPYNLWADTQEKWVAEIKADPEIGGANLEKSLAVAARAIETYGTPELRAALAFTGAGNNPHVIRWMHKVGQTLGEGRPVDGKPLAVEKPSMAAQLYPSMKASA